MANFSGKWNVVIATPMGKMVAVFDITDNQGVISGTASNDEETVDILEGVADGNRLTWKQNVSKPMKLTLKVDVTIDGDTITGTAKAGMFPASKLSGSKEPVAVA